MFGRILVATDLTETTRMSLRAALELAQQDEREILLLHVIERVPNIEEGELQEFYDRLRHDARKRLFDLTRGFVRQRGVEIQCELTVGRPADDIVRVADQRGVDLIVLLHHRMHDAPVLGSVSYKVSTLAKCSVLLLKRIAAPTAQAAG